MIKSIGTRAAASLLASFAALTIGVCPQSVFALDAAAGGQTSPTSAAGDTSGLEEIIVTARKQQERLQDVPISITAYTAKDIERYQTQSLTDVANLTPQLIIGNSGNPTGSIFLRGIGASDNSSSIDQAVSINVDGIQVSQAQIIRLAQLDLNQIEILKGPQSLFYGKDSPGGVISLNSADPGPNFESKIRTGYEIYNQEEFLEGMVSGPISDVLGARLDLYALNQKGWFVDEVTPAPGVTLPQTTTYPDQRQYFGRVTLLFKPNEEFDSKLKINSARLNQKNGPGGDLHLYDCPLGIGQNAGGLGGAAACDHLSRYYTLGALSPAAAALEPHFGDGQPFYSSAQDLAALTANYRPVKELTLTSVTGYYKDGEDFSENYCRSQLACLAAYNFLDIAQWTQEFRARTSLPWPVNFMVGAFYQHLTLNTANGVLFGPPVAPINLLYENEYNKETTDSYSGFAQAIYDFAPQWELTAGARYTSESKSFHEIRYPSVLNNFGPAATLPLLVPREHFTNISPEATLNFRPSNDITYYGAYRQGFVAGGFNGVSFLAPNSDNSYRPEIAKGGELGIKGLLWDQQFRFDADIYHYKYSDLQLSSFDPQTLSLPVINAGAATIYGIEGSLQYAPKALPQLSFRGSAAYNHDRYDSFIASCYGAQTIAQGCNLNLFGGHYNSQNLGGAPLGHAPTWAAAVGTSYELPISDRMGLTSSIDANYTSSFNTLTEEDPRAVQQSFWKVDLALALHSPDHGWEVAIIGKNLTNRLTITETNETPFTGQGYGKAGPIIASDLDGAVAAPRTVTIQLTLTNALFH